MTPEREKQIENWIGVVFFAGVAVVILAYVAAKLLGY